MKSLERTPSRPIKTTAFHPAFLSASGRPGFQVVPSLRPLEGVGGVDGLNFAIANEQTNRAGRGLTSDKLQVRCHSVFSAKKDKGSETVAQSLGLGLGAR